MWLTKYGSRMVTTFGLVISFIGLLGLALMQFDTPMWLIMIMIFITIALPILVSTVPVEQMMNMFVVGGMDQPVPVQIAFTEGITVAFRISAAITILAIIISAVRGTDEQAVI